MVKHVRGRGFRKWFDDATYEFRNCCCGPSGCDDFRCAYGQTLMALKPRTAHQIYHWSRRLRGRPFRYASWEMHVIHKQYRAKRRHW